MNSFALPFDSRRHEFEKCPPKVDVRSTPSDEEI